ncbi:glycosyl hydrolase family 26 [Geodermatophilus normandii]|uniref:Glycosyl hydrolase family 26 n=1 Tax=Geodermatophilus normandii TaxID=1137989 RepID=A0A317QCE2_9ACTN|nr:glycosyl hydrolase [Geodermatophilus normandii]PWW21328.1 glycosyl hydrolase family 26 [Geodermatophilus normandii]
MAITGTWARLAVLATAAAVLLSGGALLPAVSAQAAPPGCTHDAVVCPSRVYVGASVPGLPSDPNATAAFTAATGVDPSVVLFFAGLNYQVDREALQRLVDDDRLPMMTWEPYDSTQPTANPYPLSRIAAGDFDAYLRQQASRIAAVDGPVAIRFAHEMNGNWYPWGAGVNGNTPADYVAAYRHVHDVVTGAGATNAVWVWAPNVVDWPTPGDVGPYYPGDAYVDWAGFDAYFDDTNDTARLFAATVGQLDRVAPAKPIYVAETAVLPGSTRPAMILDQVAGLLAIPRLVGFTWFDHPSRHDWRIENDPTAAAALREALTSPYFGGAGHVDDPVVAPPVAMGPPWITGTAHVGQTLASSTGSWRATAESGALTLARRWYRCTDPVSPSSCVATAYTGGGFVPGSGYVGAFLRVAVTASNDVGSVVAWSAPTQAVLMTPATPAAPTVEGYSGALKIVFPRTVPTGATHWRLSIDGAPKQLIPVSTTTYWLTGLSNGTSYDLSLAAVSASSTGALSSAVTTGTAVPMAFPWNPSVSVTGTTVTVQVPRTAPTGATGWRLTVGTAIRDLPLDARPEVFTGLPPGVATPWTLRALAGGWNGQPGTSQAASGIFTPVTSEQLPASPVVPFVEARDGALRVVFPPAPARATHWQLTVDGVAKQLIPVGRADYWLTGLTNGRSYTIGLAGAVVTATASATGPATSGTAAPMPAPWNPVVTVVDTTATVTLPRTVPVGATGWQLTVGDVTRILPVGTTTSQFTGLVPGAATRWELRAVAGTWNGQSGSVTPAASGTFTPASVVPGQPAAPLVEARDGALRVVFPSPPADATHWRLTVDGVARQLVGIDRADYWLTGMTNGRSYSLSLAAVHMSSSASTTGPATTGTAVPMPAPYAPWISVRSSTATVQLPRVAPTGATAWRLTVGGVTRDLPIGTVMSEFTSLSGQVVSWELRAVAGIWAGGPGSTTPAVSGTFTG